MADWTRKSTTSSPWLTSRQRASGQIIRVELVGGARSSRSDIHGGRVEDKNINSENMFGCVCDTFPKTSNKRPYCSLCTLLSVACLDDVELRVYFVECSLAYSLNRVGMKADGVRYASIIRYALSLSQSVQAMVLCGFHVHSDSVGAYSYVEGMGELRPQEVRTFLSPFYTIIEGKWWTATSLVVYMLVIVHVLISLVVFDKVCFPFGGRPWYG